MAFSTLLQIVQRAAAELGLPRPSSVAAATDPQAVQLFALANAIGRDLLKRHAWGALQKLGVVTTLNGTTDYALAADFDRFIEDTQWDRSQHWRARPMTPQVDRYLRESGFADAGIRKFRKMGRNVRLWPTPTADNQVFVYEYVSSDWARAQNGDAKDEMTEDTDTTVFPPELVVAGVKYAFMATKGFEATDLRSVYEQQVSNEIADDLGMGDLNMGGGFPDEIADPFGAIVIPAVGVPGSEPGDGGEVEIPNRIPSNIVLSNANVLEGSAEDTAVGTFIVFDPDEGDTHTIVLTNTAGGRFKLFGPELRVGATPLVASDGTQIITVVATDQGGLSITKSFSINILDVNEAPTNIILSSSTVSEDATIGTVIGTLATIDPDPLQSFTYTIVADPDAKFSVSGNSLLTAATFDYAVATSHSVTIRTTDQGGLFFEKAFTINVLDVP